MKRLIHISLAVSLILLLVQCLHSCTGHESSQYTVIPPEGWIYGDTVYMYPQPIVADGDTATVCQGDISLVVRHTNNYEYSNLWVQLTYDTADSVVTDTVNVLLADDYGTWLGQGIGISYQCTRPIARNVAVDLTSPIRVSHIMRIDTLPDIEQVGIVFLPATK